MKVIVNIVNNSVVTERIFYNRDMVVEREDVG